MKTILCFGDSNTWGYMPKVDRPVLDATNRYPWGVRWTSLLDARLGDGYRVVEEGLNGRTTMFDCPMEDHRNGLKDIDVCLLTHNPIDMIVITLGTNDVKPAFNMSPYIIAHGIERLIARVRANLCGPGGKDPQILIVAPIRIGENVEKQWLGVEFDASSLRKDAMLAEEYRKVAEAQGVHFLDAGARITADPADCIHMNEEGHRLFAELVYEKIRAIEEEG
ncbi:MAG: SGNH/GDSL hydrolase family protein [Clostridia bacterium]|nr:SGNH/GDSL hydrolase family protein [Clostridia bacterium]